MIANKLQTIHTEVGNIKSAIVEKGGSPTTLDTFADEIRGIESGGGKQYTGHADVEGLRAIGWDDADIAEFQANGVNWDEEDDDKFKVSDYDKEAATTINSDNYLSYTGLTYLPKFTVPSNANFRLQNEYSLIGIPIIQGVKAYSNLFQYCYCLRHIPFEIDKGKYTSVNYPFRGCASLAKLPHYPWDTLASFSYAFQQCKRLEEIDLTGMNDNVTLFSNAFYMCSNLKKIKGLVITNKCTSISSMLSNCSNLISVSGSIDLSGVTSGVSGSDFSSCYNLRDILITALPSKNVSFTNCYSLSHESLLSILNALPQITDTTTLTIGTINLSKLTTEEIAIGTQKGWTIN